MKLLIALALLAAVAAAAATTTCTTDADCVDSYCLNYAPHTKPYSCHDADPSSSATGAASDTGAPPNVSGATCKTDADCPDSYCLNFAPHLAPFKCHDTDYPFCSDPTMRCQHQGDLYELSCSVDSNCPKGAYCMNYAPHIAPFVCHENNAPVCACTCVSGWEGPTCDVWNNHAPSKIVGGYAAFCAAKEKLALAAQEQEYNPFSGYLGTGWDATNGELKMPAVALSYEDSTKTFQGRRMPAGSTFTDIRGSGAMPAAAASHGVLNLQSFADLRTKIEDGRASMANTKTPVGGIYNAAGLTSDFEKFFLSDSAMGVVREQFNFYDMTLDTSSVKPDQWLSYVLNSLPATMSSSSELAAYASVVEHWGTHYITSSTLGALVEFRIEYPYFINDMPSFFGGHLSQPEVMANFADDFTIAAGILPDGTPASAAQIDAAKAALNHEYKKTRQVQPLQCVGSNPEDCKANLQSFIANINPNSAIPVAVAATPIYELMPAGAVRDNMENYINGLMRTQAASWNAASSCPHCARGSCRGDSIACSCTTNSYGRKCDACAPGYGAGGDCAKPVCPGCNVGGGTCVSPGHCQCHSCYAGGNCDHYTCGCFDADATVLRSDNVTVPVSQVQQGDAVLALNPDTNALEFSPVYYSRVNNVGATGEVTMVEIAVEDMAKPLKLTSEHLVYVSAVWTPSASMKTASEVQASEVQAGDYVWVSPSKASTKPVLRRVTGVSQAQESAEVVSLFTLAGPVVVDGIVASSYEWNSAWQKAENLEARLMFQYLPSVATSEWYRNHVTWWDDHVTEPMQPALRMASNAVAAIPGALSATLELLGVALDLLHIFSSPSQ